MLGKRNYLFGVGIIVLDVLEQQQTKQQQQQQQKQQKLAY
jgi:hypothetical protein